MRLQRTITINDVKITLVVRSRTHVGNFIGFSARVNDNKGHKLHIRQINVIDSQIAMDKAFVTFIKKYY